MMPEPSPAALIAAALRGLPNLKLEAEFVKTAGAAPVLKLVILRPAAPMNCCPAAALDNIETDYRRTDDQQICHVENTAYQIVRPFLPTAFFSSVGSLQDFSAAGRPA
jgi:hypothetical protein